MSDPKFLPVPAAQRNGRSNGDMVPRQYFDTPPGNPPVEIVEEEDALMTYWRVVRRHQSWLLLAATLGTIVGVLITFPETPVYQATTAIEIQGINTDFLNMRSLNPTVSASWDTSIDI